MSSKYVTAGLYSKTFKREDGLIEIRTNKLDWISRLILFSSEGFPYIPKVKEIYIKDDLLIRVLPEYKALDYLVTPVYQKSLIHHPKVELPRLQKTLDALHEKAEAFDVVELLCWDLHKWNFMRNPRTGKILLTDPLKPFWGPDQNVELRDLRQNQIVEALGIKAL